MKVYVARHAETNYNVLGLCNDDPSVDVHLTKKGIKQGKELAAKLKDVSFDLIITSQFPRTQHTAALVNEGHEAPTTSDTRIGDVQTGFEGKPVALFRAKRRLAADR